MKRLFLPIAAAAATLLPTALPAQTESAGELKLFRDWIVGCDNVKDCEAQALIAEGEEMPVILTVIRRAGPGGQTTISIPLESSRPPIAMLVDGKRLPQRLRVEDGTVRFGAIASDALLPLLLKGDQMELIDIQGIVVGRASLSGIAAALLYADEQQGRTGTVTASLRKGTQPATDVPARVAPPVIKIPTVTRTAPPDKLSAASIEALRKTNDCDVDPKSMGRREDWQRIDEKRSLLLLSCGAGAYNESSMAFVITSAGKRKGLDAAYAKFDHEPTDGSPVSLVNAGWDAAEGILSSHNKGRGIGDCGTSERYAWDGERFRMIDQRAMTECRGSLEWIRIWTATTARPNMVTGR